MKKKSTVLLPITFFFHYYFILFFFFWMWSRDGAGVTVLASHRCVIPGPQCHMWVEFVVVSRPCSEGFSLGSPVVLPLQKPTRQISTRP